MSRLKKVHTSDADLQGVFKAGGGSWHKVQAAFHMHLKHAIFMIFWVF